VNPARSAFSAPLLIGGAEQQVLDLTDGEGVDVAIEAVGVPATFDLCTRAGVITGIVRKVSKCSYSAHRRG
jgi:threonine dehydrogenase-like Zn-dependent dehydrogenase